jgi:tetratricopeptide (TPR) repeat protein
MSLVLLTAAVLCAHGDRVILHNGGVIEGIVEEHGEQGVSIRTAAGRLQLSREEIASVQISSRGISRLQMGKSLYQAGRLDQAKEQFRQALQQPDTHHEAQQYLERIEKQKQQQLREAADELIEQAKSLAGRMRFEDAIQLLTEAMKEEAVARDRLRHFRGTIRLQQADELINHSQYWKAKEVLVLAHEDSGSSARLHWLLGRIDKREGRYAQAREEFRLARRARATDGVPAREVIDGEIERAEAMLAVRTAPGLPPRAPLSLPELEPEGNLLALIVRIGEEFDIDPLLVEAVIEAESSFREDAVSAAGAQGLMQLMPGTARDMGVVDPFDPEQNIRGGTRYLAMMLEQFGGDLTKALAAYNAGPHKVKIYNGIPPYSETRRYVPKVMKRYEELKQSGSSLQAAG